MLRFINEFKSLLALALPVSLAQLAIVGMTATDVLIAGNASTVDLAGINLGANTWNMIICFFMGVGFATQPLVAKHFGANNEAGIKRQLHQSMWLCFGLGVIATLLTWLASYLLSFINYEVELLTIARNYLVVIALCAIPSAMIPAVRGTLEGMSFPRPVFWINLSAFLINIPLDYVLVNGLYGFPKLGGVGCAWATVLLVWCMFLVNVLVLNRHKMLAHLKLLSAFSKPDRNAIESTLKLGFPIGVSIFIELSMFCGAGMMIAMFGTIEAAAHSVAITIASMSFMLYMGLGQGVTIRASQFLGANQADKAWYTIKSGTSINILVSIVMCYIFIFYNEALIGLFSSDKQVIELAIVLLYFGAAFQIADSLQIAVVSALRAYHDTASPPKYQFIAFFVVGLPLGVGLAFYAWWPGLEGAKGLWFAMVASLSLVGVMLLRRLIVMVREFTFTNNTNTTLK